MQKTRFPAVLSTFVLCYAFWILLTWSFAVQELAAGAVVSLAAALFAARFFIHEKAFRLVHPRRFFSSRSRWTCPTAMPRRCLPTPSR